MGKKKKVKIKKIQIVRFSVQILGLVLTILAFFTNLPIAMTVLIGITFLIGPVFCGWICPYGFMQEVFSKVGKILGIRKRKMPKNIHQVLVFSRYIVLAFVLLVSTDLIFSFMSYDPRANLATALLGGTITFLGWGILIGFLIISLFFERPFCNYLCTEGAKYGLFSIFRPLTIRRNEDTCVGCGKCDKVCPMNIQVCKYEQVRSLHCINCLECVEICPAKNTLTIGITPFKKSTRKILFPLMIVVSLLFFGYIVYNNNELVINGMGTISAQSDANETSASEGDSTQSEINTAEVGATQNEINTTEDEITQSETNTQTDTTTSDTTDSTAQVIQGETAEALGDAAGISDGTYEGSGKGFKGTTTVEVTVENQLITEIVVTQTRDDRKWFERAYEAMVSRIIEAQSTSVDTVSGATYSSVGIRDAVEDALDSAK